MIKYRCGYVAERCDSVRQPIRSVILKLPLLAVTVGQCDLIARIIVSVQYNVTCAVNGFYQ